MAMTPETAFGIQTWKPTHNTCVILPWVTLGLYKFCIATAAYLQTVVSIE